MKMSGIRRRGPLNFRFTGNFSEIPCETKKETLHRISGKLG